MSDFSDLELSPALLTRVASLGFTTPTPVQARSLPPILAGRDVIAQAATGSGKTAAFGLGLLQALEVDRAALQALVICPTRELADQVASALRELAAAIANVKIVVLCGGSPTRVQVASLAHAPHIVVGTPGRLLAHFKRKSLDASELRTLVLDEADRMLDMGFADDIDAIVSHLPGSRQTLLFSATWPDAIRETSTRLQTDPVDIRADARVDDTPAIEHRFYQVKSADKPALLLDLLALAIDDGPRSGQALVFCNTRAQVDALVADLTRRQLSALALHGEHDQRDRDEVLIRFANRSALVLVATDVAARGLDIAALPLVASYDVALDVDTHTHRIGRTARAGARGMAVTLCEASEAHRAERIALDAREMLIWHGLPQHKRQPRARPPMATLLIAAGRRDKLRPGDILGALTGDAGLDGEAVGQIDVTPTRAYVAVAREHADTALTRLREGQIKGRRFRVMALGWK